MAARTGKGKISEMDKKYFREIFNLHAKDEKIDYEGLCRIFEMVDFKPNEKQEVEFKAMFSKKDLIGFQGKRASDDRSQISSKFSRSRATISTTKWT